VTTLFTIYNSFGQHQEKV